MPITLTSFQENNLCVGHVWKIDNERQLVQLVAEVLIGKQRHVAKVLKGISGRDIIFNKNAVDDAINKLTLSEEGDPSHRDGLIFQIFSWLAAHKAVGERSIIAAPHLIPAVR